MADDKAFQELAVGQVGLLMVAQALLRCGFQVAVPVVDTGYDLLALKKGRVWRLQVKSTARKSGGGGRVRARRGARNHLSYTAEHCDAIVAVHVAKGLIKCMTLKQLNGRTWMNFSEGPCANAFEALN
jgi:hypothetical protein